MSADATLWSSEAWASAPDVTLLARTREGSAEAFGELWRRHLPAAYAVANRHRGRSAPEDVVAEAAARVLALIRDGRGPDENFRAYFLSAVRTVAVDQGRRDLRLVPTEDDDLEELAPALADPFAGLAADEEGLALVRTAFAELSERDQRILWHTTVEGAAPRAVAPVLGMTANAVSVRAMRAREALRANYLDARAARELPGADSDDCRWTVTHLGAFVRGRLPKRQTERARAHVEGCPHAAALAAELRAIHDGFPAIVVPAVLAAGLMTPGFVTGGAAAAL
ncbi:MAG: sigma-70 family RNA polymerase sigma factor, partial [Dermatophilaceae bacterium]|nr:sigma-70 family RNA polymerase sigma factor [Dermatophilaceae bacterium]